MIRIREGFKDQILHVVPPALRRVYSEHPLVYPLMPTDIGWYPNARYHYCEREHGTPEHILAMCVNGAGWFNVAGTYGVLLPNQAMLIPRDTPHVYGASDDQPWSIYWVHICGVTADNFVRQMPTGQYSIMIAPETTAYLSQLFRQCCAALDAIFVLQRMIYAAQMLHHLLAALFFNNRAFSPTLQTSQFHSLDSTTTYLHDHVHQPLTLAQMAEHAQLSIPHFSRLFKAQTGFSPMDYFIRLKMQHACRLLSLSRLTVREIALEVGYEDPYYFSRLFKKVMGVSPLHYRHKSSSDFFAASVDQQ